MRALEQFGLQFRVAPDGDGQFRAGDFEQPVNDLARLLFSGVDDVKNLSRLA